MKASARVAGTRKEFVSWIILVVSTLFIQIVDWQIDEFKSSLDLMTIEAENYLQGFTASTIIAETSWLKSLLPLDDLKNDIKQKYIQQIVSEFDGQLVKKIEIQEAVSNLKNGQIGLKKYFSQIAAIQQKEAQKRIQKYNRTVDGFKYKKRDGTCWTTAKSVLLVIQFICLVYIGAGFFRDLHDAFKHNK